MRYLFTFIIFLFFNQLVISQQFGCISGNCDNGYGTYVWRNDSKSEGDSYTGNWKGGLKHGLGTFKFADGSIYSGNFEYNKISGTGTFIWSDGSKYVGQWKSNRQHGKGVHTYPGGKRIEGYWENGILLRKTQPETTSHKDTSNLFNFGCISGNCQNDYSIYIYPDGSRYTGDWLNGKYHGHGTFLYSNGNKYTGEFKNGKMSGSGSFYYAGDGRKFVGEFKENSINGFGTMIYANNTLKNGYWIDNQYVGTKTNIDSTIIFKWLHPSDYITTSYDSIVYFQFYLKTNQNTQKIDIVVNNMVYVIEQNRGFQVITSSYENNVEKSVKLQKGENTIYFRISLENNEYLSEPRVITYKPGNTTKRTALIIGNSKYLAAPLLNPVNDAVAMANALKSTGFNVILKTDVTTTEMKLCLRDFGELLVREGGVGLFYFAGHGIQVNNENYLLPVDALIEKEQDAEFEAVNLQRVLGEMEYANNDLNIVILDACRNNPFSKSYRSVSYNGLASTIAPKGTFIAYATAPGSVAADGTDGHGLYTAELLKAMQIPDIKLEEVFKEVRRNVYQKSEKKQVPWENSSIFGDFYFTRRN